MDSLIFLVLLRRNGQVVRLGQELTSKVPSWAWRRISCTPECLIEPRSVRSSAE
jgi:hypothetical protein